MTISVACSFCGEPFSQDNPSNSVGYCRDALACVKRKWAKEETELKHKEAKG